MSLINTLSNGLSNAQSWLTDAQDLLAGMSSDHKKLKNQVTNSITDDEGNPIIWDAGRFIDQNEILKRFHMGNEFGSQSSNAVFAPGLEDPTRLMFKVEFGEWGASLLGLETIRAQQVTSKFSSVYYEDYDQFPMGLLNLDFIDTNIREGWSQQNSYNTYNYLLNRNEDARASYIKQFVQGLYVIQKDMPYIFQKISGLDKLQELNLGKGKRLKDAKITIDCLEGIDLKIRTLLQLYRKAAYDDVWQRWVLPDIYRYFKMIIYVFDRRILHTGAGTYSVEQDDFPIYAFECGPCEFDIESTFENELSSVYSDHKDSETKINITVHDVKTYYSNKLFNKVESNNYVVNWIGDFDSVQEQGNYKSTDSAENSNFRQRWLRRMFMMPSEYRAYYNNVTHKFGTWTEDVDDKNISDADFMYMHDGGGVIWPDNSWHKAVVQDESIYDIRSWSGLVKYLKKLARAHNTMIRDSRFADRDYMVNDLTRPYEFTYIYEPRFMYMGPDVRRAQNMMRHRIAQMIQHMLNSTYVRGRHYFYNLIDPGMLDSSLAKMKPNVTPSVSMPLPEHTYVEPILDTSLPDQSYTELVMNLDKRDQTYVEPILDLHKNHAQYVEPEINLDKQDQTYVEPEMNLDKPEQDYIEPIMNLDKPDQTYVYPEMNLDKPNQEYVYPEINLDKPDQTYVEPEIDLHKILQTYVEPIMDLHKYHGPYVEPEMNLDKPNQEYVEPEMDLHKYHGPYVKPEMNLDKPEQTYVKPIEDTHTNHSPYVEPEMNLDKPDQTYVELIIENHNSSMTYVEPEKPQEHVHQTMVKPTFDTEHVHQTMFKPEGPQEHVHQTMVTYDTNDETPQQGLLSTTYYQDEHKPTMNLIPDLHDEHKQTQNLIHDLQDEHKVNMNYVKPIQDTMTGPQTLVHPEIDTDREKHNLIPLTVDGAPQSHNQMVEPEYNEFKSKTLLTPLDGDDTKFKTQMNPLDVNTKTNFIDMVSLNSEQSKTTMDMTELTGNTEIPTIDMTRLSQNTSIPEMDMTRLSQNTSLPEMDMTYLPQNTSIAEMIMQRPNDDASLPEMIMQRPNENTSLPDMDMTHINLNTSLPEMDMTRVNLNSSLPEMIMQKPLMNTSINSMVMTKPMIADASVNMIMTEPLVASETGNMTMTRPNEVKDIPVTPMVSPNLNTDKVHAHMVTPNLNTDKVHTLMVSPDMNTDKAQSVMNGVNIDIEHPTQEMTRPIIDTSLSTMDMVTTILDNGETPKMKMVELTDSPELVQKIQALTKIDVNELKTTNIQDLLSLADIIEKTYDEIKDRSKHMKLQDNKPNIPPHVHMKMQSIKQPERNQYLVNKINAVDQAAIDRAWNAKHNAESDHSEGRKGNAI